MMSGGWCKWHCFMHIVLLSYLMGDSTRNPGSWRPPKDVGPGDHSITMWRLCRWWMEGCAHYSTMWTLTISRYSARICFYYLILIPVLHSSRSEGKLPPNLMVHHNFSFCNYMILYVYMHIYTVYSLIYPIFIYQSQIMFHCFFIPNEYPTISFEFHV